MPTTAGKCFLTLNTLAVNSWCSKSNETYVGNSVAHFQKEQSHQEFKVSLCPIFTKRCPNREEQQPEWAVQVSDGVWVVLPDASWQQFLPLYRRHRVVSRARQAAWGTFYKKDVPAGAGRWQLLTMMCNEVTRWEQNPESFEFEVIFPHKLFIPFFFFSV